MKESRVADLLTPVLARHGLELEAVEVVPAGRRRVVRLVVDGDGPEGRGPLLDDIAAASSACSAALDASAADGHAAYTLEVSSRGVDRPLQLPRHWRRNVGRLVAVTTTEGPRRVGRIVAAGEQGATLEVGGQPVEQPYADVAKALVQVELNRPATMGEDA